METREEITSNIAELKAIYYAREIAELDFWRIQDTANAVLRGLEFLTDTFAYIDTMTVQDSDGYESGFLAVERYPTELDVIYNTLCNVSLGEWWRAHTKLKTDEKYSLQRK